MIVPISVPMTVSASNVTIPMTIDAKYDFIHTDIYDGETEFTPTQEEQIVETKNKVVLENIKINPIPVNYALVTWTGSVLQIGGPFEQEPRIGSAQIDRAVLLS